MELNSYIIILISPKHKKPPSSSGAKAIFFSFIAIVHIYLWMCTKLKIYIYIKLNFSLLFYLKNIFSFFLFLSPAYLLSSFFLLIFFSLPHLLSALPICFGSSSSSSLPICSRFIFIAVPRHRPISPNPPSHR